MKPRYEIKKYSQKPSRGRTGNYRVTQLYGIWDNNINNWVINTNGIGKDIAKRVLHELNKPRPVVRRKTFWQEK